MGVQSRIHVTLDTLNGTNNKWQSAKNERNWPVYRYATPSPKVIGPVGSVCTHEKIKVRKRKHEAAELVAKKINKEY